MRHLSMDVMTRCDHQLFMAGDDCRDLVVPKNSQL